MVVLGSVVADPAWGDDHREHLSDLERGASHAEGKDVLAALDGMVVRELLDVGRIIEVTVPFRLNETAVVLAQTLQTPPAGRRDVRLPVCRTHEMSTGQLDEDSSVDNGDQMGVSDEVQNMTRPWPVDTGEEEVAVERFDEAFRFDDREIQRLDVRIGRCGVELQTISGHVNLCSTEVAVCCVHEPVEVVSLDGIEVDEPDLPNSGAGKRLGNKRPNAAKPDDANAKACNVCLGGIAPGRASAQLLCLLSRSSLTRRLDSGDEPRSLPRCKGVAPDECGIRSVASCRSLVALISFIGYSARARRRRDGCDRRP